MYTHTHTHGDEVVAAMREKIQGAVKSDSLSTIKQKTKKQRENHKFEFALLFTRQEVGGKKGTVKYDVSRLFGGMTEVLLIVTDKKKRSSFMCRRRMTHSFFGCCEYESPVENIQSAEHLSETHPTTRRRDHTRSP